MRKGAIKWPNRTKFRVLRIEKYTSLKKYTKKLIHPRICIECKISWLAPSSSFGSFIPEMLFIISLGTKARAGGVFSQREFIVSTISALVHHHSLWHLGKSQIVYFFARSGKDIFMDLVGHLFFTVFVSYFLHFLLL